MKNKYEDRSYKKKAIKRRYPFNQGNNFEDFIKIIMSEEDNCSLISTIQRFQMSNNFRHQRRRKYDHGSSTKIIQLGRFKTKNVK